MTSKNEAAKATHVMVWLHRWSDGTQSDVRLYLRKEADGAWQLVDAYRLCEDGVLEKFGRDAYADVEESFNDNAATGYDFDHEVEPLKDQETKAAAVPAYQPPRVTDPVISDEARLVFNDVLAAMEHAEGMYAPPDYAPLMQAIICEAVQRLANYATWHTHAANTYAKEYFKRITDPEI